MKIEITVPMLYMPKRIDAFLAEAFTGHYSREELKVALSAGQITLNGQKVRPSTAVQEGDRIEGSAISTRQTSLIAEKIPVKVIYEDESLLVIDKPAGMVVHPGAGNKKGTLVHALLGRGGALSTLGGNERPGIVHRLDKDTSGVIVVAKNNQAHRFLQSQFESRTLSKTYIALVKGSVEFEEGHITKSIGHHPKIRMKMAVSKHEKAKEADTRYTVMKRFRYTTLLSVRILTGRTHQIRVHMADLGHPVVGDPLYGTKDEFAKRPALHAAKIELTHPVTKEIMSFESPLPDDFKEMVKRAEAQR